ncbi:MAG TPA: DUF3093 domain-containing protein [Natronosporangium sp.]|nr:DUF3093 domain-containing protein [Natronosporangium sp.]
MGRDQPRPAWRYRERLLPPWYWWPVAAVLAAGAGLQLGVAAVNAGVPLWVPVAVLVVITLAVLAWFGRVRVTVTDTGLLVGRASLPSTVIAEVVPLDAEGRRELLGPAADPLALVVQRPWVSGAVQVVLDDPADPTPYWLVSTRAPDRLADALAPLVRPREQGRPDPRV